MPAASPISTPLWRTLSSAAAADLPALAADPAVLAQVRAALPDLIRRAHPCGPEAVRRALAPLVLVYGVGEAARSAAFWGVYVETLRGLPAEALAAAVADYAGQAGAEFFPKPGPLKALALRHAEPLRRATERARRVVEMPVIPRHRPALAERKAQIAQLLSALLPLREKVAAKRSDEGSIDRSASAQHHGCTSLKGQRDPSSDLLRRPPSPARGEGNSWDDCA